MRFHNAGHMGMTDGHELKDIRRSILQILATAIDRHDVHSEGRDIEKPHKRMKGEKFRPLQIVDLDLRKSTLAQGTKKTYLFHFRVSEAAPKEWIKLFDDYYPNDKSVLGNAAAKCVGSHIVVRAHKDQISAIKDHLDDYVARTNRRYSNSLDRTWNAHLQAIRQKEELEELRDAMFPGRKG